VRTNGTLDRQGGCGCKCKSNCHLHGLHEPVRGLLAEEKPRGRPLAARARHDERVITEPSMEANNNNSVVSAQPPPLFKGEGKVSATHLIPYPSPFFIAKQTGAGGSHSRCSSDTRVEEARRLYSSWGGCE